MIRKVAIVLLVAGLAASPAVAKNNKDKGNKGKAKGKSTTVHVVETQPQATVVRSVTGERVVLFADRDREVVRTYYVDTYGRAGCPPGLAKKNNGCLPPGQAKKRYAVGQRLPNGIVLADLPRELSLRIGAAPSGYRYGLVDGDLVKLAVGTMLVVDAIQGFVQ